MVSLSAEREGRDLTKNLSRRSLLKGAVAGAAGLASAYLIGMESDVNADAGLPMRVIVPGLARDGVAPAPTPSAGYPPTPTTLKGWATLLGIEIGTFGGSVEFNDYALVIEREVNLITDAGFEFSNIRPDRKSFVYKDGILGWAEKKRLPTHAYHLVWWAYLPTWLARTNGWSRDSDLTPADIRSVLIEHIATVVAHYKGRIAGWSVVNEAIGMGPAGDGTIHRTFWYQNLGLEYIELAFRTAREADPSVKLIWNEDHNEALGPNSNLQYELVKSMLLRGVPIDGIGMQMHLNAANPPNGEDVQTNIKRFLDLGIDVLVTEFDVDLSEVSGTQGERWKVQGDIFAAMLRAYLRAGGKSFAMFGLSDKYSWYTKQGKSKSEATPFDSNLKPKPAYFKMTEVLKAIAIERDLLARAT